MAGNETVSGEENEVQWAIFALRETLSATTNDYGAWNKAYAFIEHSTSLASMQQEFKNEALQGLTRELGADHGPGVARSLWNVMVTATENGGI